MSEKCRTCFAPIIWLTQAKSQNPDGKRAPINAEPSPEGTIQIYPVTGVYLIHPKDKAEKFRAAGEKLYTSHFATCPQAARHRRKKSEDLLFGPGAKK